MREKQHKLNNFLLKLSNQLVIKKTFNKIITPWYSIPLIDRWLLGQIIPPMVFAISAFTVISLSVGVMFDLIRKIVEFGLPIFVALKVLFFSLPSFLVLSFPMAVLLFAFYIISLWEIIKQFRIISVEIFRNKNLQNYFSSHCSFNIYDGFNLLF